MDDARSRRDVGRRDEERALGTATATRSESPGNPEDGAVIAIGVEGNVGPVPLHGISAVGGEPLVLQGAVEDVERDPEPPVASGLQE